MSAQQVNPPKFSVDTKLFRELGELLVGRESTALIELVKNAYDADATSITVHGESLGDPKRGKIRLVDDGVGMDLVTFQRGFLRIASRTRDEGNRRSSKYERRFTGAKGVGRLAAHKLAARIDVTSHRKGVKAIAAHIDWNKVEEAETIDLVSTDALNVSEISSRTQLAMGTIIELSQLKTKWSKHRLNQFVVQVHGLQAPMILSGLVPKAVVKGKTLFAAATVADRRADDPGFLVKLEGDFDVGDSYESAILEAAHWLLEIDASRAMVRYAIHPTELAKRDPKVATRPRPITFEMEHPDPDEGPFFHARIFVKAGVLNGSEDLSAWNKEHTGVRIYLEGFRLLPFGELSDDWLGLNRDAAARGRGLGELDKGSLGAEFNTIRIDPKEGLFLLPNKHYFGAVFLTVDRCPSLKVLVTREGLVPNEGYEHLVFVVRRGVDLMTRVRASFKGVSRRSKMSRAGSFVEEELFESVQAVPPLTRATVDALDTFDQQSEKLMLLIDQVSPDVAAQLGGIAEQLADAAAEVRETIPANSLIRILASVGTQLAAFTHEVSRLLVMANELAALIELRKNKTSSGEERRVLASIQAPVAELRQAIERQAAYLGDVITPDARRRRSAQPIAEIFELASRLLAASAERRGIVIENNIPKELNSPPMFKAELVAVFTNLLTNALKAAGRLGVVNANGQVAADGTVTILLENTGVAVNLDEAERWFRPYESTTTDIDPVLGQGMGLGLPIARDILAEVGGGVHFVAPSKGFATGVEITLRRTRQ